MGSQSYQVSEAWKEHEKLVQWTIWRILRRYGGDFDELLSEALVLFTEAVLTWDESKSELPTWICYFCYKGLLETKRTEARHLNITGPIGRLQDVYAEEKPFVRL